MPMNTIQSEKGRQHDSVGGDRTSAEGKARKPGHKGEMENRVVIGFTIFHLLLIDVNMLAKTGLVGLSK